GFFTSFSSVWISWSISSDTIITTRTLPKLFLNLMATLTSTRFLRELHQQYCNSSKTGYLFFELDMDGNSIHSLLGDVRMHKIRRSIPRIFQRMGSSGGFGVTWILGTFISLSWWNLLAGTI
nr:hypothetical protein [Candidatus Sigynarchaeota archaeon]